MGGGVQCPGSRGLDLKKTKSESIDLNMKLVKVDFSFFNLIFLLSALFDLRLPEEQHVSSSSSLP